ncbi:baculoviral IAP repeat-containing protein 7-like [Paramacrobiotus metropolitanus]|uniref:baculoviral IAP repeat-containing protein 7-like n=1 Tax=Paramacrobiotus metropolitanus TaxID=2943436 RepID=UPI0024459E21|nr:baculoviral IAP repeat-containing protein 7-like [Paramacrobiotus metropolitanus]
MAVVPSESVLLKPEVDHLKSGSASAPNLLLSRSVSATSDEGVVSDLEHPALHCTESDPVIRRRKSHIAEDSVDCDILPYRHSRSPDSSSDDEADMRNVGNRLESFSRWPLTFLSPSSLAVTGFFYTGVADRVRCAYCGGVLAQWAMGDNPIHEHRRHFPSCPMSRKSFIVQNQTSDLVGQDVCGLNFTVRSAEDDPLYVPSMAEYRDRFGTFANWPEDRIQSPRDLALAGLFYTGRNDRVQCFYCGQQIERWDPQDDAWTEHAKWSPSCGYLVEKKGRDFIEGVLERFGLSNSSSGFEEAPSSYSSSSRGSSYSDASMSDDDDLEPEERLIKEAYQRQCNPDYVQEALQKRRNCAYPKFRNVEEIIKAVKEIETQHELKKKLIEANKIEAKTTEVPLTLEEENERLRQERRCKVCLDKPCNMVFQPCGHAACCHTCSEKLQSCPVCRQSIQSRMRVYFS